MAKKKQTEQAVETPVEAPAPPPTPEPVKTTDAKVFTVTKKEFTPGKGLATELWAVMKSLGSATAQQATDALLASGAYQRVAPQAAKLRPVRPVETFLKRWAAQGLLDVT